MNIIWWWTHQVGVVVGRPATALASKSNRCRNRWGPPAKKVWSYIINYEGPEMPEPLNTVKGGDGGGGGIERGDLEVLCKSCFDSLCPVPFSFSLLRVQLLWPKPCLWPIQIFKRVCLRSLLCVFRINRVRFSQHHFMLFWLAAVHIVRNAWEPVSLSSDE